MVKKLFKWNQRHTTLTIGDKTYQGHVEFDSCKINTWYHHSEWSYRYSFRTDDGEKIPINSQGRNRIASINGGLVQRTHFGSL